jgi:hypothetical protein
MASQHFSQQQQYVAQQGMIYVALALVTGTLPMTIYFQELLDRPPNATGRYEVVEQVQFPWPRAQLSDSATPAIAGRIPRVHLISDRQGCAKQYFIHCDQCSWSELTERSFTAAAGLLTNYQLKMSSSAEREPVCHFGYSNMYSFPVPGYS